MSQLSIHDLQSPVMGRPVTAELPSAGKLWGVGYLVDCLGVCEFRRRLLHMSPGLLPVLLWFIPHTDPWGLPLVSTVIGLFLFVTAFAIARASDFARPQETLWHVSVIGYCVPIMALLMLLPGRSELGLLTLGVVAFGDGSAALGGKLLGGRSLPWNRRKTWSGMLCFVAAGTVMATFNYWVDARPIVSPWIALAIAAPAAVSGAIVESLPIRSHDNFRVGVTAALAGLLMHVLLLGW